MVRLCRGAANFYLMYGRKCNHEAGTCYTADGRGTGRFCGAASPGIFHPNLPMGKGEGGLALAGDPVPGGDGTHSRRHGGSHAPGPVDRLPHAVRAPRACGGPRGSGDPRPPGPRGQGDGEGISRVFAADRPSGAGVRRGFPPEDGEIGLSD